MKSSNEQQKIDIYGDQAVRAVCVDCVPSEAEEDS